MRSTTRVTNISDRETTQWSNKDQRLQSKMFSTFRGAANDSTQVPERNIVNTSSMLEHSREMNESVMNPISEVIVEGKNLKKVRSLSRNQQSRIVRH